MCAQGRPFQELLQYFAMERFLCRLAKSPFSGERGAAVPMKCGSFAVDDVFSSKLLCPAHVKVATQLTEFAQFEAMAVQGIKHTEKFV